MIVLAGGDAVRALSEEIREERIDGGVVTRLCQAPKLVFGVAKNVRSLYA